MKDYIKLKKMNAKSDQKSLKFWLGNQLYFLVCKLITKSQKGINYIPFEIDSKNLIIFKI